ncbi:MAG: nitrogen fixation protein NifW, partial [Oceanospirillales bacterium]|nr:nitrogen fixation protein NifW [Oceanospirillales bacterium]
MSDIDFLDDLEELSSAEEFLEYFDIEFDPKVVMVNRLHIMQRYHDYLQSADGAGSLPQDESAPKAAYC